MKTQNLSAFLALAASLQLVSAVRLLLRIAHLV